MNKKFFLGVAVGLVGLLIYQKAVKKPCGCKDAPAVTDTADEIEPVTMGANMGSSKETDIMQMDTNNMSCNEAVDMVVKKRMATLRFISQEAQRDYYDKVFASELLKCQNS